ncbi:hypothetical protein KJ656_01550, partial [bacterium]|nr:hypothetical protein [bacterium]
MAELNVSPGNFIICQFNVKKILLKTGLYIPDFFNNHSCDVLVEKQYEIDGQVTLEYSNTVKTLSKLEIENINGEEIDHNRLREIKKYLSDTMFPVNPGCSIYID